VDAQMAIDRITETENLTDALQDDDANWLIEWGIARAKSLIEGIKDDEAAGEKVVKLMAFMRKLNQLVGDCSAEKAPELVASIRDLSEAYGAAFRKATKHSEADYKSAADTVCKKAPQEAMQYLIDFVSLEPASPDKAALKKPTAHKKASHGKADKK
jgi:hypothetical protein